MFDHSTWSAVRFGDVVRQSKETVDPQTNGVSWYVAGEHMQTDDLRILSRGKVGDGYLGPAFHRRFSVGHVLYGSRRTYLRKVALADFDGVCANTTFVCEPSSSALLPELLPFLMQTEAFHAHSMSHSRGSVNPYVNWRDVAAYQFLLPPVEEQRRIASLLTAAEDTFRASDNAHRSSEDVVAAIRAEEFARAVADEAELGAVAVLGPQNGLTVPKGSRSGDIAMVNMGELFAAEIVKSDDQMAMVSLGDHARSGHLLAEGDLLFARRSIVPSGAGLCSLVGPLDRPTTFESSLIRVSVDRSGIMPEYLLHFFRSPAGRRRMRGIARLGTVAGIAGSDLKRLRVPVPDLAEQERLITAISAAQVASLELAAQTGAAKALKHALINRVFEPNTR